MTYSNCPIFDDVPPTIAPTEVQLTIRFRCIYRIGRSINPSGNFYKPQLDCTTLPFRILDPVVNQDTLAIAVGHYDPNNPSPSKLIAKNKGYQFQNAVTKKSPKVQFFFNIINNDDNMLLVKNGDETILYERISVLKTQKLDILVNNNSFYKPLTLLIC